MTAPRQCLYHDLIGGDIELLLDLTLDVVGPGGAELAAQPSLTYDEGDLTRRLSDILHWRNDMRHVGVATLLLEKELP